VRPSARKRPSLRRNAPLEANLQAYLIFAFSRLVIFSSMVVPFASPFIKQKGNTTALGLFDAARQGTALFCVPAAPKGKGQLL
jgi:hypothetical protein